MWLAGHGHDVKALIGVVSLDNLSGGIASAGFVVYLSSLINVRFSATQYALLSSMAVLAPKWLAGFSGHMVDAWGYPAFFAGTAMLGVPVLGLVWWVMRLQGAEAESQNPVP
jgi:PAT family beta-lactamase induction signal transducer AmpG